MRGTEHKVLCSLGAQSRSFMPLLTQVRQCPEHLPNELIDPCSRLFVYAVGMLSYISQPTEADAVFPKASHSGWASSTSNLGRGSAIGYASASEQRRSLDQASANVKIAPRHRGSGTWSHTSAISQGQHSPKLHLAVYWAASSFTAFHSLLEAEAASY